MTTQRESSGKGSAAAGPAPASQQGAPAGAIPGQQGVPAGTMPPGEQSYGPPDQSGAPVGYGSGPGYGSYQGGHDPRLAEPWRRFVGWLIDGLIIGVVGAVAWIPATVAMASRISDYVNRYPSSSTPGASAAGTQLAGQIVATTFLVIGAVVVLDILYYWLLTGLWGTTVGKRAVGAWVVSSTTWAKPGLGAAFLRALIFVVGPAIFGIFFLIDNLWLLWDSQRQCLHDKAASTLVVHGEAIGR